MKNKIKLLISTLFASLTLGVFAGVDFANNKVESVDAGTTYYYWRQVTNINQLTTGQKLMIASVSDGNIYYLNDLNNSKSSEASSGTISLADNSINLPDDSYILQTGFSDTTVGLRVGTIGTDYFDLTTGNRWPGAYVNNFGTSWPKDGDNNKKLFKIYVNGSYTNYNKCHIDSSGYIYAVDLYFLIYNGGANGATSACATNRNLPKAKLYARTDYKTVTLNKQSGTGGSSSVSGVDYHKLPKINPPTRDGYTFNGYFTSTGGSGTKVFDNNGNCVVTNGASYTTLHASWTGKTYSVSLDNQSATTAGTTSITPRFGSNMPTITKPQKTGYTFGGYYSSTNGAGTQYYTNTGASARTWDSTSITKLYAKWTVNTYKVTLDATGGSGGSTSATATYNVSMPPITVPTKPGYTFGGYYTGENGTGTQYYDLNGTSMQTYMLTDVLTLYAKWTPVTYHLSLSSQGGTGGDTTVDTVFGEAVPSVTIPTKPGYTFKGYFSGTNGTGTQYINNDGTSTGNVWNTAADSTIYAYWEANNYTVTFSKAGGTGGSDSLTVTYNETMSSISVPTRVGYLFKGYYTGENGTGTQYYDENGKTSQVYSTDGNLTLYAYWEIDDTVLNNVAGAGKIAFNYVRTATDNNQFRLVLALDSSIVEIGNSYGASEAGMYIEKNGSEVAKFDFINNKVIVKGQEAVDASIYEEKVDDLTLKYIIIDLYDLVADATYAYDTYTFCAYMKVADKYYFADNYKTYSFASLLNTYIDMMPDEISLTNCKSDLGLI